MNTLTLKQVSCHLNAELAGTEQRATPSLACCAIQPDVQELTRWNDWSIHSSHILQHFLRTHLLLRVNETGRAL